MRNMLLLLLALIVVPAWAGDAAPATQEPSAQASQAAPKHKAHKAKKAVKHKAKKAESAAENKDAAPMGSCPPGCGMMPCPVTNQCCGFTTHLPC